MSIENDEIESDEIDSDEESVESDESESDDSESESNVDYFQENPSFYTKVREAGKFIEKLPSDEEKMKAFNKQPPEVRNALRDKYGTDLFGEEEEVEQKFTKAEAKEIFQELLNEEKKNTEAPKAFDSFLEKTGWKKPEFDKKWGKTFLSIMKREISDGKDKMSATKAAIGELTMSHGFVPKKAVIEKELRERESVFPPAGNSRKEKAEPKGRQLLGKSTSPVDWYK